jgi:hypothetical protein
MVVKRSLFGPMMLDHLHHEIIGVNIWLVFIRLIALKISDVNRRAGWADPKVKN